MPVPLSLASGVDEAREAGVRQGEQVQWGEAVQHGEAGLADGLGQSTGREEARLGLLLDKGQSPLGPIPSPPAPTETGMLTISVLPVAFPPGNSGWPDTAGADFRLWGFTAAAFLMTGLRTGFLGLLYIGLRDLIGADLLREGLGWLAFPRPESDTDFL